MEKIEEEIENLKKHKAFLQKKKKAAERSVRILSLCIDSITEEIKQKQKIKRCLKKGMAVEEIEANFTDIKFTDIKNGE